MIEKDSFARFHAYQSILLSAAWIVFWIAWSIVSGILFHIPFLGFLAVIIGMLVSLALGVRRMLLDILMTATYDLMHENDHPYRRTAA